MQATDQILVMRYLDQERTGLRTSQSTAGIHQRMLWEVSSDRWWTIPASACIIASFALSVLHTQAGNIMERRMNLLQSEAHAWSDSSNWDSLMSLQCQPLGL